MIKKKKIARFRELYDYISDLLESYSYDDVSKILLDEKGLDLTPGTLKNYVYRHRQKLAKTQSVENIIDNTHEQTASNISNSNLKVEPEDSSLGNTQNEDDDSNQDLQSIDLDTALEKLKRKESNKTILD